MCRGAFGSDIMDAELCLGYKFESASEHDRTQVPKRLIGRRCLYQHEGAEMARSWLSGLVMALACGLGQALAQPVEVLTGGKAGVYYPVGLKLKQLLESELPGVTVNVRSTQGTVENLNILQRGTGHLALAQGDILSAAVEGNPEAGFPSSRTKIRLIGAAYPNYIHVVARRDAGVASIRDLVGKRVSVGAARSGNELNARALLGAVRLSYADLRHVEYLHYGESVDLLVKGELDAIIVSAGLHVQAVVDASNRAQVMLVPIEPDIVAANPRMFFATTIPAGTYPGQGNAVPTAALNNYFVTTIDASESMIHDITRVIYGNVDKVRAFHPAIGGISAEGALAVRPIEVHPGALRFFRSKGLTR